jgi:hypothetical protein
MTRGQMAVFLEKLNAVATGHTLWAVGTLARGFHATSVVKSRSAGIYRVVFDRDISLWAFVESLGEPEIALGRGQFGADCIRGRQRGALCERLTPTGRLRTSASTWPCTADSIPTRRQEDTMRSPCGDPP